jgi:hypothetical protein
LRFQNGYHVSVKSKFHFEIHYPHFSQWSRDDKLQLWYMEYKTVSREMQYCNLNVCAVCWVPWDQFFFTRSLLDLICNDIKDFYTPSPFARLDTHTLIEHTGSPNCISLSSVSCLCLAKKNRALPSFVDYRHVFNIFSI